MSGENRSEKDEVVGPDAGEETSAGPSVDASSLVENKDSSSSSGDGNSNVSVSCEPGQKAVLRGVKNQLQVLLSITTAKSKNERPPIQLSAVLDKSGSMQGECLENSKKAICKLIKHLQPDKDKMHFVVYDTEVKTVFENGDLSNKDGLKGLVKAVRAGTSTNLHGGLQKGAHLLTVEGENTVEDRSIRRVFLFSDGLVNAGLIDKPQILAAVDELVKTGTTVTTFGIGSSFDESLMTQIADRGKGEYYFLESAKTIAKHVSKSVHGLMNVVGTEAKLKVRGLGGATVTKIFGQDNASLVRGTDLGDLHADNVRQVLIELDVLPEAGSGVEFSLEYCVEKGPPCVLKGRCVLDVVEDEEMIKMSNGVLVATAIQKNAEMIRRVETLINTDKQAAINLQKEANALLTPVLTLDVSGQVQKVLDRCEKALKRLEEGKESAEVIRRQYAYEGRLQRKMSFCAYDSGEDSDDVEDDAPKSPSPVDNSFPRVQAQGRRRRSHSSPPRRRGSSCDSGSVSPPQSPITVASTPAGTGTKKSFFNLFQRRLS